MIERENPQPLCSSGIPNRLTRRLLGESYDAEAIRKRVESEIIRGEKTSTSVGLPVSQAAKRVFEYSAEEADRSNQQQLGTLHLLIGLLRARDRLTIGNMKHRNPLRPRDRIAVTVQHLAHLAHQCIGKERLLQEGSART